MQGLNRLRYALGAAFAGISLLLSVPIGQAADQVVFRYGIFRQRLSVIELTKFAEKGEISPVLDRYLQRTNANPAEVRRTLNDPLQINKSTVETLLKNPAGERMLDELGKMIQTPDDQGNREALQTALVKSAANDNKVTILEIIQNYPTDEIHLDVKRMIKTYNTLNKLVQPAQGVLNQLGPLRDLLKKQGVKL